MRNREQDGRPTRSRADHEQPGPLDPIAITLAIWLGLIVAVTGFMQMANDAEIHAALSRKPATSVASPGEAEFQAATQMMAYGG